MTRLRYVSKVVGSTVSWCGDGIVMPCDLDMWMRFVSMFWEALWQKRQWLGSNSTVEEESELSSLSLECSISLLVAG